MLKLILYYICLLNLILWASVVLRKPVVFFEKNWCFDKLSRSHLKRHVNCKPSFDGITAIGAFRFL